MGVMATKMTTFCQLCRWPSSLRRMSFFSAFGCVMSQESVSQLLAALARRRVTYEVPRVHESCHACGKPCRAHVALTSTGRALIGAVSTGGESSADSSMAVDGGKAVASVTADDQPRLPVRFEIGGGWRERGDSVMVDDAELLCQGCAAGPKQDREHDAHEKSKRHRTVLEKKYPR